MTKNIEDVIEALGSGDTGKRYDATQKLVEYGSSALPKLLNVFARDGIAPIVKAGIVSILGHIGDEQAVALLTNIVILGWEEPEKIDFIILERVPLALGMLVQSRLRNPEKQFNDSPTSAAVDSLTKSLGEKTMEYRLSKFSERIDPAKAIHENIAYRLNVIAAFKLIGDVNTTVDMLGFALSTPLMLEEIPVIISAVEALGWIGATHLYKESYDKDKVTSRSIERASLNTEQAIKILESIVYRKGTYKQVGKYEEVRITARNALKLITGKTD